MSRAARLRGGLLTSLVAALLGALAGVAAAEGPWTVQTVAFQDHRQAVATVEELRRLGFDAYSEFAMNDGKQFSRVRIGCFREKDAADAFARALRGRITQQAVVQPLSAAATPRTCVDSDVGFIKPAAWRLERSDATGVLFRVETLGQVGYVEWAGGRWAVLDAPSGPAGGAAGAPERYHQAFPGGVAMVQAKLAGGAVHVCNGRLLWQGRGVAVVERTSAVVACAVNEDAGAYSP